MNRTEIMLKLAASLGPIQVRDDGQLALGAYPFVTEHADAAALRTAGGPLPGPVDAGLEGLAPDAHLVPANAARFQGVDDPLTARSWGRPVEKLSWCARTGELLFVHPPQQHRTARGTRPFDDYVRIIVLHELRLLCARPCWPTWARPHPDATFDARAAWVSTVLQLQARTVLLPPESRDGWCFELNINNRRLEHLTGRRGW